MNPIVITCAVGIGVFMFFLSRKSHALPIGNIDVLPVAVGDWTIPYEQEMKNACAQFAIDWRLMAAHVYVESTFNPRAVNPSEPSYGLGQILCQAADRDSPCINKFPAVDSFNSYTPNNLLDVDTNLDVMSQIMASNISAYGLPKAIAVYNDWSAHTAPANGPFPNQSYVDKVEAQYQLYQSTVAR